ncbi:MAG: M20/M25/M40 family metallo-hydrolase, partial [Gammaproteobacteria bacterium]
MLKKFFLSLFAILLTLLSIALFRTFMHVAADSELDEVKVISIDEAKAVQNLAASIRFKTISYQDREKFPQQEFDNFINWASITYPEFHQALKLEQFEHSLLFKWEGSDPTLAPILFEGHYDVVPVIPGTEDLWEEMPFAGTISNNRIWGRGALDDKSGVIGLMEAAT